VNRARNRLQTAAPGFAAFASAAVLLPLAALADERSGSVLLHVAVGFGVAVGGALLVARRVRRSALGWVGGPVVAMSGWLLPQAEPSPITWILSGAIGVAVGLVAGGLLAGRRDQVRPIAGGVLFVVVAIVLDGAHAPAWCGAGFGAAMVLAAAGAPSAGRRHRRAATLLATATAVVTLATGCWIGANSPTVTWFGSQVSHGPRDRHRVAITFDDGPNVPYTARIARILDQHGAKGTFFMVGKALESEPAVARRLMDDGHLLGNHSYHHDSWRWLDPRYPELERTQDVFQRTLGVCPAFFRAPHGQHTPFMARVVDEHDMTMVGWDVSAGDWNSTDAGEVARRVLDRIEPGSIVVLHDGLDGDVTADRSVLVRALPPILEGLERRGLEAVALDELLGQAGYGAVC
jgi:peptidoglycan/xylan/chitin deacetylase (PgdA/CDA1 family)